MCGLAGVLGLGQLSSREQTVFEKLLMISHWRGEDATGVIFGAKTFKKYEGASLGISYVKDTLSSPTFVPRYRKTFDQQYKQASPITMLGHCRWATKGKLSKNNAHPFSNKHLIGMHNGTIQGEFANSKKYETDSEALLHNIGEMGVVAALEDIRSNVPAYALQWIDKRNQTLNFIKNSTRPLHFAKCAGFLAWASEKEFLEFVLPRENITPQMFYTIKDHHLISFPLTEPNCLDKAQVEDFSEQLKPKVTYVYHNSSFRADQEADLLDAAYGIGENSNGSECADSDYDVEEWPGEFKNRQNDKTDKSKDTVEWILNKAVSSSELERRLWVGCSWCSDKFKPKDKAYAVWIDEDTYVCKDCVNSCDEVRLYIDGLVKEYWEGVTEAYYKKHPEKRREGFKSAPEQHAEHQRIVDEANARADKLIADAKKARETAAKEAAKDSKIAKNTAASDPLNDPPWDDTTGSVSVH